MKNLPTLTAFLFLALACGYRVALAWQETAEKPDSAMKKTAQPIDNKELPKVSGEATGIVHQARKRLFQRQSVNAEFVQKVSLGVHKFQTGGRYLSGENFQYRLEYNVKLGGLEGKFLEVCDGKILHTSRQINKASESDLLQGEITDIELTRRDIQKILKETQQNIENTEAMHAAEIGIGGMPAVLASLARSMNFEAVKEETVNDTPYYVVQGRWKDNKREELLTGLGGPIAGQIAGLMPDLVRVWFNKETLFPERFLYLKLASAERETYLPMLSIEFANVQLDQQVSTQLFRYQAPTGVEERDETAMFIEMINLAAQQGKPAAEITPATTPGPPE